MFKDILVDTKYKDNSDNKIYIAEVKLGGNYISLKYTRSDENDTSKFIETLKKAKHNAEIRGQFFI